MSQGNDSSLSAGATGGDIPMKQNNDLYFAANQRPNIQSTAASFRSVFPHIIHDYRDSLLPEATDWVISSLLITTTATTTTSENNNMGDNIIVSDNSEQLQILRRHYDLEFGTDWKQVVQDYDPHATIHEVLDQVPRTYRGKRRARHLCRDMRHKLDSIELQHVAVNRNHAQVVWKGHPKIKGVGVGGDTSTTVWGTDSFAFDPMHTNHILSHTIVAMTTTTTATTRKPSD